MSSLSSLTSLLQESGAPFRIYDMGRHIKKISPATFAQIEQGAKIYPTPYLHHAWLALLIWNPKQKEQNVVWFLKFPLDEQGYLVQAVRDDFINRLMTNINQMLQSSDLSTAEDALKDNPFSFTPDQEKMANFHALCAKETGTAKSKFYSASAAYFSGQLAASEWQNLGYQGIAEVAVSIDSHQDKLIANIDTLAPEALIALYNCLEHVDISYKLLSTLNTQLNQALQTDNRPLSTALLRAIQAGPDKQLINESVTAVLNSDIAISAEVLTTIAVKATQSLTELDIMSLFLEKLANSEVDQNGFSRLLADLMFSQHLRTTILTAFRSPDRSEKLSIAIGNMFGAKF